MRVIQKQDNDTHTHTHRGDWHKMSETESEKKPGFHKCAILSESNGKSIFDLILYSSSIKKKNDKQIQSHSLTMLCNTILFCFLFGSIVASVWLSLKWSVVHMLHLQDVPQ